MFQLDLKEPVIRNPADRVERDDLGAIASPRVRGEGCVGLDRPRQQVQRARVRGRLRTSLFRIGPLTRTADAVSASPRTAGEETYARHHAGPTPNRSPGDRMTGSRC